MTRLRKYLLILLLLLLLCALGVLFTPISFLGTGKGDYSDVVGFGNYGVPPSGGSCENVGQTYEDNPFHGWPAHFRQCDWAIISAYFCTPNYFAGYTHWGIDLASYWSLEGSENIHGAELIATTDVGKVVQMAWFDPPKHNYGMGNFVKIEGWEPNLDAPAANCTGDPLQDLDANIFDFCWAPEETPPAICSGDPVQDWANGYFDQCWYEKPQCTFNPAQDLAHGLLEQCWKPTEWIATYMHMLDVTVEEGDWVFRGDVIGHVDNTGNSTGSHLHYQINAPDWMNVGAVDPAPTFGCPGYDWQEGVEQGR